MLASRWRSFRNQHGVEGAREAATLRAATLQSVQHLQQLGRLTQGMRVFDTEPPVAATPPTPSGDAQSSSRVLEAVPALVAPKCTHCEVTTPPSKCCHHPSSLSTWPVGTFIVMANCSEYVAAVCAVWGLGVVAYLVDASVGPQLHYGHGQPKVVVVCPQDLPRVPRRRLRKGVERELRAGAALHFSTS